MYASAQKNDLGRRKRACFRFGLLFDAFLWNTGKTNGFLFFNSKFMANRFFCGNETRHDGSDVFCLKKKTNKTPGFDLSENKLANKSFVSPWERKKNISFYLLTLFLL